MNLFRLCLGLLVAFQPLVAVAGVQPSTWGGVKQIYRGDETPVKGRLPSTQNERDRTMFPFPGGDWNANVLWEARHALGWKNNGISTWEVPRDSYGARWLGDWDYISSDPTALAHASAEAYGVVGPVSDTADGHHRGGWCTFFARLVLYRSSYGAGYGSHLMMPNPWGRDPGGVYGWCNSRYMTQNFWAARPGWIIMAPGIPHTAILEMLEYQGGRWGWWVVDSNWVGSDAGYRYYIGKHFIPMSVLQSQYWAWAPTLATTN